MMDMSMLVWILFLPSYSGIVQAPTTYWKAEHCQAVAKELSESGLHLLGARKPLCIQARIKNS